MRMEHYVKVSQSIKSDMPRFMFSTNVTEASESPFIFPLNPQIHGALNYFNWDTSGPVEQLLKKLSKKEQQNQTFRTQSIVNQLSKRKPAQTYNDQACHLLQMWRQDNTNRIRSQRVRQGRRKTKGTDTIELKHSCFSTAIFCSISTK